MKKEVSVSVGDVVAKALKAAKKALSGLASAHIQAVDTKAK